MHRVKYTDNKAEKIMISIIRKIDHLNHPTLYPLNNEILHEQQQLKKLMARIGPSSLVAIPAIVWATSLNRTTVARAIAAAIATVLRSVAAAIANKYVMIHIDQSNGEKAFQISPTSFNITLLIAWFYPGRIPNNGTAVRHQL